MVQKSLGGFKGHTQIGGILQATAPAEKIKQIQGKRKKIAGRAG